CMCLWELCGRLVVCSSSSCVYGSRASGLPAFGATVTSSFCSSGGAELRVGSAVDRVSLTLDQSSPVCCVTAARYSTCTASCAVLPARNLYCGRHDTVSTR